MICGGSYEMEQTIYLILPTFWKCDKKQRTTEHENWARWLNKSGDQKAAMDSLVRYQGQTSYTITRNTGARRGWQV